MSMALPGLGGVDQLGRYDRGLLTVFRGGVDFPRFMHVHEMVFDQNGFLYVAASGVHLDDPGLIRFDGEQFEVFNPTNSGLFHDQVLDVAVDSDNVVWLLHREGLSRYDGDWQTFSFVGTGIGNNGQSLVIDGNDDLWIGTQGADNVLVRFDGTSWETFSAPLNLMSLVADDSGHIWGGGRDMRLGRFQSGNWEIENLSGPLSGNSIYGISLVDEGLLVSTWDEMGLFRNGNVVPLTDLNDRITDGFHISTPSPNGDLFMGTQNGFAVYNQKSSQGDNWLGPMFQSWPLEVTVLNFSSVYNGLVTTPSP